MAELLHHRDPPGQPVVPGGGARRPAEEPDPAVSGVHQGLCGGDRAGAAVDVDPGVGGAVVRVLPRAPEGDERDAAGDQLGRPGVARVRVGEDELAGQALGGHLPDGGDLVGLAVGGEQHHVLVVAVGLGAELVQQAVEQRPGAVLVGVADADAEGAGPLLAQQPGAHVDGVAEFRDRLLDAKAGLSPDQRRLVQDVADGLRRHPGMGGDVGEPDGHRASSRRPCVVRDWGPRRADRGGSGLGSI